MLLKDVKTRAISEQQIFLARRQWWGVLFVLILEPFGWSHEGADK
jgi:hypothetical protein